ncbi:ankyrin repeat-containing domain protein [Xylariaceae sp. FL1651]|nr:ankyrin repeat-containing domain protein [Xylariaceae sp. FL1651]
MEALGAASAIITLIEVSHKLLVACYRLRGQWKNYEEDISELILEVERLSDISEELREIVDDAEGEKALCQLPPPPGTGIKRGSALTACRSALEASTSVLVELSDQLAPLTRTRFRDKLKWPFASGSVARKVDFIQKQKSTLELALSTYQTKLLANQSRQTDDRYMREKREAVLRWFKTSDPEQNHIASRESHEPGTGHWIFETEGFKQWVNTSGGLLWLHGIPGAGKTILCSTVIDHLQKLSGSASPNNDDKYGRVLFYYFTFSDDSKQSLANFLKFAIYQLISINKGLSEAAAVLHDSKNHGLNEPSVNELINTLRAEASSRVGKVYLVVDALDECPKKERRAFYEKALKPILSANISLMISSRKEPDIEQTLRGISSCEIRIENDDINADVRAHVESVISQDRMLQAMKPSIQKEIIDGIVSGARGMFRWAVCQLEVMRGCLTPAMVREKLKTMPRDLDQTYDRILGDIPTFHRPFVQSALHWLVFSARPLLLEELAEASVICPDAEFDPESPRLLSPTLILDLCGVLVRLSTINSQAEWLDTKKMIESRRTRPYSTAHNVVVISLSHYSVKEYLISQPLHHGTLSGFYTSEHLCNSFLAKCCLTYLLSFNSSDIAGDFDFEEYPLLEYANQNWMSHWKTASEAGEDTNLHSLVERMFQPESSAAYANWLNIWDPDCWHDKFRDSCIRIKKSVDLFPQTIYWAASLGHMSLVRGLVEKGADVEKPEGYWGSAFGAAAFYGHLHIVNYFLQKGANPSLHAPKPGSVLQIAVKGGSYAVVKRLIEVGADINAQGGEDGTALIAAISKQYHDIVNLLISKGANVQASSQSHGTPLYQAALTGDTTLVTNLLNSGADINETGDAGELSPLYSAVDSGSIALLNFLLEKGADVNKEDNNSDYGYPLVLAAVGGHVNMVQAFLRAGADPNLSKDTGVTPLEASIDRRDTAVFQLLLDANADINVPSKWNETLFTTALSLEAFSFAKTLIDRGIHYDDSSMLWEFFVSSPLHVAITMKDEKAIWAILQQGPNVNAVDEQNWLTPLCLAISSGMIEVAKELIRRGADINRTRTIRHSPFEFAIQHACVEGSLEIADLLLDLGVNINDSNENALFWAVDMNNNSVLRYLVDKGIDLNQTMSGKGRCVNRFTWGIPDQTPVQYAAQKGDLQLIQLLLDSSADINGPSGRQGPTLHYGILSKNPAVVEFLLEHGNIPDDNGGHSAIHKAINGDFQDMIPTLLDYGADINANENGESPLAAAVRVRNGEIIALLRKSGAYFSSSDGAILSETIKRGTIAELQELLDSGLEPNAQSNFGLNETIRRGNYEAVEILIQYGATISTVEHQQLLEDVCRMGDLKMATILLDNCPDFDISGGLVSATRIANNIKVVDMLLKRGAIVNGACFDNAAHAGREMLLHLLDLPMTAAEKQEYLGRALQSAATRGHLSLCKWLIDDWEADVNYCGEPQGTPLQAAVTNSQETLNDQILIVDMLLSRGAHINPPVTSKKPHASPLSRALRRMGAPSVKPLAHMLLERGADVNLAGGEYHVPLQLAAYFCPYMLEDILDAGADINTIGGSFGTALHAAANRHDVKAVKLLLSRGADARIIAGRYGSVLQSVAQGRWPLAGPSSKAIVQVMDLLIKAGADVNAQCGKYVSFSPLLGYTHREDYADFAFRYGSAVQAAAAKGNIAALKCLAANGANVRARGGKWGNAYRAALNKEKALLTQWRVISWLELHYGREGWEDDTKE